MSKTTSEHNEPLLQVEDLFVEYPVGGKRRLSAVSGVSFEIALGETLGLVGESGCGKSSLARGVMQLLVPASGRVVLEGKTLNLLSSSELRRLRSRFQMIFQDPVSSLNPSRPVGESIEAPLRAMGRMTAAQRRDKAREMMAAVGLDPDQYYRRLPQQLSGGQCQRVSIARALVTGPKLLVCDEPVSSLDVSVQAQILNLLRELRDGLGLSLLFIAHDLAVVKNICDRVAVMYLGRLCELAPSEELYRAPAHRYTAALISAIPRPDPLHPLSDTLLQGELPSPLDPPSGCRFSTRCPRAGTLCLTNPPEMRELAEGHWVACHFPLRPVTAQDPESAWT